MMQWAAALFSLILSGVYALPAGSVSDADWLSTIWDVIVVGEYSQVFKLALLPLIRPSRQALDQQESL